MQWKTYGISDGVDMPDVGVGGETSWLMLDGCDMVEGGGNCAAIAESLRCAAL